MSKLARETSWYTLGGVLPGMVSFLLIPVYTRYLTPEDYGILSSMDVIYSIASIFFILALDRSISRFYHDHKSDNSRRNFFGTIMLSIFFTSSLMLVVFFTLRDYIGKIFISINFFPFIFIALLTSFFSVYSRLPMTYYRLTGQAKKYVYISLLQFILRLLLKIFFVVILLKGAYGALLGGLLTNVLFSVFFIYVSFKISNLNFNKEIFTDSLKFTLPMLPVILAAFIIDFSDRIFLERYTSLSELGIYSLGISIASSIFLFSNSFNKAFEPIFYEIANSSQSSNKKKEILSSYLNNYIFFTIFFCFSLAFFSKEIIYILAESKFHEAYKITMLMSLGYVLLFSSSIFNLMIYQVKKSYLVMYSTFISAPSNVIFNILLIPQYGIYGAGYTTILSFLIAFLVKSYFAKRCFYVPVSWSYSISLVVFLILVVMFNYLLFLNQPIIISLIAKLGIFLLLLITLFRNITLTLLESFRNRQFTLVE